MRSLSWQLLKAVLSIYFVITLLVTLSQMGIEYLHTRDAIQSELGSIERTFSPALSTAIWEINAEQLEALHQGILALPVIAGVNLVDASGRTLIDDPSESGLGDSIVHRFKLFHQFAGESVYLAEVSFASTGKIVFDRLSLGFQMIVISAIIKSTVLTLLFLWTVRRHLGIPLQKFTNAVDGIDLDSLVDRRHLDLSQEQNNELTTLENAFNRMLTRLEEERVAHYSALEELNRALEQQVAERTLALKQANEKLEQQVRTDPLTGAANRRHFMEHAHIEIQRARRDNTPLSLLMIDLDHFKHINDTWGHSIGDEVLNNFTRIALSSLRVTDFLARIGGEEFAILLPNTNQDGAIEVSLRVLEATRQQSIDCINGPVRYSASIGASVLGIQECSSELLLKRADAALYRAKNSGRNQVVAVTSQDSEIESINIDGLT